MFFYYMFNKPAGCITARRDPRHKTVMDYFPEEVEKIDCATVKVFGNYIIYSFLNEADTEAFYNAIENQIAK